MYTWVSRSADRYLVFFLHLRVYKKNFPGWKGFNLYLCIYIAISYIYIYVYICACIVGCYAPSCTYLGAYTHAESKLNVSTCIFI